MKPDPKPRLKADVVRSEPYRRYISALPCFMCRIEGFSQVAHGDEGKGAGLKSSDTTCYPLCAPRPGEQGCHYYVGTTGKMGRDLRRDFEQRGAAWTQEQLILRSWEDRKLRALLVKLGVVAA